MPRSPVASYDNPQAYKLALAEHLEMVQRDARYRNTDHKVEVCGAVFVFRSRCQGDKRLSTELLYDDESKLNPEDLKAAIAKVMPELAERTKEGTAEAVATYDLSQAIATEDVAGAEGE